MIKGILKGCFSTPAHLGYEKRALYGDRADCHPVLGILALLRSSNSTSTGAKAGGDKPKTCPSCGNSVQAEWKHCPFCGVSLEG